MKTLKIFTLSVLLTLISWQCSIRNLEPLRTPYKILKTGEGAEVTLYEEPEIKENVFSIDSITKASIISVSPNQIIFKGRPSLIGGGNLRNLRHTNGLAEEGSIIQVLQESVEGSLSIFKGLVLQITEIAENEPNIGETTIKVEPVNNWSMTDIFKTWRGNIRLPVHIQPALNVNAIVPIASEYEYGEDLSTNQSKSFNLKVNGQVQIDCTIDLIIEIENSKLKVLEASLDYHQQINANTEFIHKINYEVIMPLKSIPLPPIPVPLGGPIVVPITPTVTIDRKLNLNGEFGIKGTFYNSDIRAKGAFRYLEGDSETIRQFFDVTQAPDGDGFIGVNGNGSLSICIVPKLDFQIAKFDLITLGVSCDLCYGAEMACNDETEGVKASRFVSIIPKLNAGLDFFFGEGNFSLGAPEDTYKHTFATKKIANATCKIPELQPDFKRIEDERFRRDLKRYDFPINEGNTPPEIVASTNQSSTYQSESFILKKSDYAPDILSVLQKDKIDLIQFVFSKINSQTKLEVTTIGNTNRRERYSVDASFDPQITGSDDKFTIIGKCAGTIYGVDNIQGNKNPKYINKFAISGRKIGNKIEDIHYFILYENVNDCPDSQCLPSGRYRYYTSIEASLKP